jgi:hypothetical protein
MKRILDNKVVKFIAKDRKYRIEPYQAVAPLSTSLNTYVTGQHVDYNDKSTKGNLTIKEITGEVEIKPAARKALFPHVINHIDPVLIIHNKGYDCRLNSDGTPANPKDYTEAYFIIAQTGLVARSEKEANTRHKFYLEDKEANATVFVNNSDKVYEAQKLIREKASIEDYKDLVSMLNLSVTGFNVSIENLSDTRLKEILLKQAAEDPDTITLAFTERGKDILFLSKLILNNILRHKPGNGYYDGEAFIALDTEKFVNFINDGANSSIVGKWGTLLKQIQ